jgi:hypothetical protein
MGFKGSEVQILSPRPIKSEGYSYNRSLFLLEKLTGYKIEAPLKIKSAPYFSGQKENFKLYLLPGSQPQCCLFLVRSLLAHVHPRPESPA